LLDGGPTSGKVRAWTEATLLSDRSKETVTTVRGNDMVRSRLGLKALGLCALVFGLMAFAASAQAETGAKWALIKKSDGKLVNIAPVTDPDGKGIGDVLLPELQITELEELKDVTDPGKHAVLLSIIAGKKVALLCKKANFEGVKLLLLGSILGKITFEECIFKIGGITQGVCKPHTEKDPEGTIKSVLAEGLIKLHKLVSDGKLDDTVLITPENALGELIEKFTTIILGKEGVENECSVGEKLPISGKLSIKDCLGFFRQEKPTHLIEEFPALTELWVLNKSVEHTATIDGSAIVELAGEHKGFEWAGLPN
jgi:hypothetical protein